jgi:hypothetical protein
MDVGEPTGPIDPSTPPLAIEAMLGYTGSIGTALWYEIGKDCGKVGRKRPRIFPFLMFSSVGVELKMEVERQDRDLANYHNECDLLDDCMMDVEMSVKGAHTMIASMKEDVQELQTSVANAHNQMELIRSDDIAWC